MLPRRKNNQLRFCVAVTKHWNNEWICSSLVLWELNNIIAGRAMFQSRKFNTRPEIFGGNVLLRKKASINIMIASMMEIILCPLFVSFFFDRWFGLFKKTVAAVLMVPFMIDEFRAW